MSRNALVAAAICAALLATSGCSTPPLTRRARPAAEVARERADPRDEHDGWWSAYRRADGVTVAVNVWPALHVEEREYVPLVVAVANEKMDRLTLTGESLTLVDESGRRYPIATWRELRPTFRRFARHDWWRGGVGPCLTNLTPAYRVVPGFGTWAIDWEDRPNVGWAKLGPKFMTCDLMYFVRPPGPLAGRDFRLALKAREMEGALVFPFRIE